LFFFRPKRKHVDVVVMGLGNPGPRYARSRHNLGFAVADVLAREWAAGGAWRTASHYLYLEGASGGKQFLLMKPTTFMNLSGNAIRKAGRKFEISPRNLVVIHDDLDVEYGRVKFKLGGSPAGHRGVTGVADRLGTQDFYRLKMGIGLEGIKGGEHYVLEQLDDDEWAEFAPAIELACRGVELFLAQGPAEAIKYVNTHGKRIGGNAELEPEKNGG
jgi:PTH1 family peptidyl-tRNA hydrolase